MYIRSPSIPVIYLILAVNTLETLHHYSLNPQDPAVHHLSSTRGMKIVKQKERGFSKRCLEEFSCGYGSLQCTALLLCPIYSNQTNSLMLGFCFVLLFWGWFVCLLSFVLIWVFLVDNYIFLGGKESHFPSLPGMKYY